MSNSNWSFLAVVSLILEDGGRTIGNRSSKSGVDFVRPRRCWSRIVSKSTEPLALCWALHCFVPFDIVISKEFVTTIHRSPCLVDRSVFKTKRIKERTLAPTRLLLHPKRKSPKRNHNQEQERRKPKSRIAEALLTLANAYTKWEWLQRTCLAVIASMKSFPKSKRPISPRFWQSIQTKEETPNR